jgi:hypothetical protein
MIILAGALYALLASAVIAAVYYFNAAMKAISKREQWTRSALIGIVQPVTKKLEACLKYVTLYAAVRWLVIKAKGIFSEKKDS